MNCTLLGVFRFKRPFLVRGPNSSWRLPINQYTTLVTDTTKGTSKELIWLQRTLSFAIYSHLGNTIYVYPQQVVFLFLLDRAQTLLLVYSPSIMLSNVFHLNYWIFVFFFFFFYGLGIMRAKPRLRVSGGE